MDGNIFNSQGVHVAIVRATILGASTYAKNICKLSGELVGHLANMTASERHLDKATDKLFPVP